MRVFARRVCTIDILTGTSKTRNRLFSSSTAAMASQKLRIGYVPEHFSTPLHYAMSKFGLSEHASLKAFPSGTGTMIEAFQNDEIDVGVGLTEAWIAGLAKGGHLTGDSTQDSGRPYHLFSAYVESPLRWALSTGAGRKDVNDINELDGTKVGVSRMGSGSHIMSFVLADQKGWLKRKGELPMEVVVCGPFADLRTAVNNGKADFFMWEHYTTKRYYDNGELKKIGEIPTPWNSWHIVAKGNTTDERVRDIMSPALFKGVDYFEQNKAESVEFIASNMDYSKEDAESWYAEVQFTKSIGAVNQTGVEAAISSLQKAGVIKSDAAIPWQAVQGA